MPAIDFVTANPYLFAQVFGLVTLGIFWLMAGPQRSLMLLSGAITLPFSPIGMLFDGEYWTPLRLGGGSFGVEDALYTFVLGGRAWFLAVAAFRAEYVATASLSRFARRTTAVTVASLLAYAVLFALGLGATLPSMLVPAGLLTWLLVRQPDLRPLALCGGLGLVLLNYAELQLFFRIWPHLPTWWTVGTPWSRDCLGAPCGDLVWSVVVGATHPAVFAFLLDVRRHTEPARS